jgi:hypothetical protein
MPNAYPMLANGLDGRSRTVWAHPPLNIEPLVRIEAYSENSQIVCATQTLIFQ